MNNKDKKENRIIIFGIGLIFVILLITLGRYSLNKKVDLTEKNSSKNSIYSDYKYITPIDLNKKIINRENITLIDIRDSVSFEKNHIEDSLNISPQNFDETIKSLSKDNLIIIISYDNSQKNNVSAFIKKLKTELEFKNILALTGGILGWAEEGNQLISGGNKDSALDWSKIDYIRPEQLKLALEKKYPVFVLDVRPNNQFRLGHISTAINIPLVELEKRRAEIPISKEILVYGATPDDDFKASVKLNDLGFLATYTIEGGLPVWQEKRFEIIK